MNSKTVVLLYDSRLCMLLAGTRKDYTTGYSPHRIYRRHGTDLIILVYAWVNNTVVVPGGKTTNRKRDEQKDKKAENEVWGGGGPFAAIRAVWIQSIGIGTSCQCLYTSSVLQPPIPLSLSLSLPFCSEFYHSEEKRIQTSSKQAKAIKTLIFPLFCFCYGRWRMGCGTTTHRDGLVEPKLGWIRDS